MTNDTGFMRGKLIVTFLGRKISPVIAAIARNHVPETAHQDFLDFVWTGCSTVQLEMIIRYMGGTPTDLHHIEIEEMGGALHATAQIKGGINYMGDAVMLPARLPETLRTALVGMPLSTLVDHPLLPGNERITGVRAMGSVLTAELGTRSQRDHQSFTQP